MALTIDYFSNGVEKAEIAKQNLNIYMILYVRYVETVEESLVVDLFVWDAFAGVKFPRPEITQDDLQIKRSE